MKYLAIAMMMLVPSFVSADEVVLVQVKTVPVVRTVYTTRAVRLLPRRSVHRKVERNGMTFERSVNR